MRGNPGKPNLKNHLKRERRVMDQYRELFAKARDEYGAKLAEVYAPRLKSFVGKCFFKANKNNGETTFIYLRVKQVELNLAIDGSEHHILHVDAFTYVMENGRFMRCSFERGYRQYLGYAGEEISREEYDDALNRVFLIVKNCGEDQRVVSHG